MQCFHRLHWLEERGGVNENRSNSAKNLQLMGKSPKQSPKPDAVVPEPF